MTTERYDGWHSSEKGYDMFASSSTLAVPSLQTMRRLAQQQKEGIHNNDDASTATGTTGTARGLPDLQDGIKTGNYTQDYIKKLEEKKNPIGIGGIGRLLL